MLDENDPWLDRVTDVDVVNPLSDIARKERTNLMIANLLMFAVFQMRLVPTKIAFLGLETNKISAGAIMIASVLGVIFFAVSFALTTRSEHRAWRSRLELLRERHELRQRFYLNKDLKRMREWIDNDVVPLVESKGHVMTSNQKQDLIAQRIAAFGNYVVVTWKEYKKGYEIRFFVDAKLPLIVTALNLAATPIAIYFCSSMLHGEMC